ncbi:MAG: DUF3857 domain-containing protein [Deltaproteobacteria bacterium]
MKRIPPLVFLACFGLAGCFSRGAEEHRADLLARASARLAADAQHYYKKALAAAAGQEERARLELKLGDFLFETGRFRQAADVLRGAPGADARRRLAQSLFKSGDVTGALEVFNRIGAEGPPDYLYDYGQTLEESKLYDQALRVYGRIARDPQQGSRARARIAAIELQAGGASFAGVSEEVRRLIRESPAQEAYPDAGALLLLVDESVTLTDDGRLENAAHTVIKVLNDRGKEAYGEITLPYDATYEKLDVLYARTIAPDGRVVSVGDKNVRDVSLYLNFPMYSNARARILSMPEVAPGAVIEYAFSVTQAQLPDKKNFDTAYWLQSEDPILLERCVIDVPAGRALKTKVVNGAFNTFGYTLAPRVEEKDGRLRYHLEFRDVPQIIPEPDMPPAASINPYLLFSTYADWQEIYLWWRDLYRDKTDADAAIREKVAALIKDAKTPSERARAIYDFCAQEIRYVAVEYGDAGYEPHRASEIFANRYGDCKDQAILLIAMLKEAGIEAYPVLVSTWDSLTTQQDLPALLFNHAIAAAQLDGALVFLDPTGSVVSFGDLPLMDQGRDVLVFYPDHPEFVTTPVFEPAFNSIDSRMVIRVHADESIDAERTVATSGSFLQAQRYWLKYTMPVLVEEGLKERVRAFADQARLTDYAISGVDDLDAPVRLSYTFTAPQFLVQAGPIRILNNMEPWDTSGVSRQTRRYPIAAPGLEEHIDRIEVDLPEHLAVKYVPPDIEEKTPWFDFSQKYEAGAHRVVITGVRRATARLIPAAEYPAYKAKIETIASSVNQHVILEEVTAPHASKKKTP